jgi:N-acetylglutamate synthase-like GNAT family acetyltransferase
MNPRLSSVRRMDVEDEVAVKALAGRAFSPLASLSFPRSPDALIAERRGELVGAVVLRTFGLSGGRKSGVMTWLMTDPGARGLGVGGRLVEAALQSFQEQDCREVFACVEGYNSSSANLFAARGFTILSFGEQLRRYGFLGTLLLWLRTSRLGGDVGHFLWARRAQAKPDSPTLQWWIGALANALVLLLAGWRGNWLGDLDPATLVGVVLIVVTVLGLREGSMRLVAWLRGLPVRHRAWESAFPLSLGVALLLGVFLPTPGSVYPRQDAWHYRDLLPKLGPIAFAGALAVLLFAWAAWALAGSGGPSTELTQWLSNAYRAGLMLAAFDVLVPFSPFVSFDGRRVWDWNRTAWGVLAVAVLGLLLVRGYPFVVVALQR